jgi:hypothetical protein
VDRSVITGDVVLVDAPIDTMMLGTPCDRFILHSKLRSVATIVVGPGSRTEVPLLIDMST